MFTLAKRCCPILLEVLKLHFKLLVTPPLDSVLQYNIHKTPISVSDEPYVDQKRKNCQEQSQMMNGAIQEATQKY
jgi:hypothetical protein